MMTPTEITILILATTSEEAVDERPGLLIIRATLADIGVRERWIALRESPPDYVNSVTITEADNDTILEQGDIPEPGVVYRITIQTRQEPGQLCLFFARSLTRCDADLSMVDHVLVANMTPHETFSTYRSRFQLWTNDPVEPFAPSEQLPDPRAYVSDFTGNTEVPADIRLWLERGAPERSGMAHKVWGLLAARKLMAALSERVSLCDGVAEYHFNGPPSCAVSLTDEEAVAVLAKLQEGGAWVFLEARDTDTRHLLLAVEWARTHHRGQAVELGEGALESAKAAYAAYVKSGSRETLKALADLRRAVVDEGQKAAQRAQDLAGAMWKDIAIAAAPFVLKFFSDASKASSHTLTATLAFCAALFLIFSFCIQVFINNRYFKQQKEGRLVWQKEINIALRQREIEELSEAPIQESLRDYKKVVIAVGVVYVVLVCVLLCFARLNSLSSPEVDKTGSDLGRSVTSEPEIQPAPTPEKGLPPAKPNEGTPPPQPQPDDGTARTPDFSI